MPTSALKNRFSFCFLRRPLLVGRKSGAVQGHMLHAPQGDFTWMGNGIIQRLFFNDTATTEIYTLSLHDALPILRKYGYDYPFEQTRDILKQAQIVFGNLEGPLTDGGAAGTVKQYVFRSPPDQVAPALARAGLNIVSLANNHTLDYGPEGLEDTRAALDKAGIRYAGAGRNVTE